MLIELFFFGTNFGQLIKIFLFLSLLSSINLINTLIIVIIICFLNLFNEKIWEQIVFERNQANKIKEKIK